MLKLVSFAVAGLVASAAASAQITFPAQGSGSTAPAPAQTTAPNKSALICENEEDTGSRVSRKRVCHTAEEWQSLKAQSRDAIEKYQQQATGTPVSG
jgi:hypothetical protein